MSRLDSPCFSEALPEIATDLSPSLDPELPQRFEEIDNELAAIPSDIPRPPIPPWNFTTPEENLPCCVMSI
jgi:hypothetical protein